MPDPTKKAIFRATNKKTGEVILVTDFYWFKKNYVHGMDGKGLFDEYLLEYIYDFHWFEENYIFDTARIYDKEKTPCQP